MQADINSIFQSLTTAAFHNINKNCMCIQHAASRRAESQDTHVPIIVYAMHTIGKFEELINAKIM